jgi:hypothetical protein
MTHRVASLFVALAFISAPVFAQGPPGGIPGGGGVQSLTKDLADLKARVDKLEGNIVAADLAGTYSVVGLSTTMTAFHAGAPPIPATINTTAFSATFTLNAGGTGTASATLCQGSTLTQGSWAMQGVDCGQPATGITWTYADGVVTITFLSDGDGLPFNVGPGGRLLVNAFAGFHPSDPSSDQFLIIATRLR